MKPSNALKLARLEGRICPQCQWIIKKRDWKNGFRICRNCIDVNKGVNVKHGHYIDSDEFSERTSETI
jgi:hypothetical protein